MKSIRRSLLAVMAAICLGNLLSGCATTNVSSQTEVVPASTNHLPVIYVNDFELEVTTIKLGPNQPERGLLRQRFLAGVAKDSNGFHDQAVDFMAMAVVKGLKEAGYDVRRLPRDCFLPTDGWLLRGVFVDVYEHNRIRRTVVGFDSGSAELKVAVAICDLKRGVPKPFYTMDALGNSSRVPGAGPLIVLSIPTIPVRFVLSGQNMADCMEKTAVLIDSEVCASIQKMSNSTK